MMIIVHCCKLVVQQPEQWCRSKFWGIFWAVGGRWRGQTRSTFWCFFALFVCFLGGEQNYSPRVFRGNRPLPNSRDRHLWTWV